MRKLIERLLARFGYVLVRTQPRVTPEPTLAEAAFHFGIREAQQQAKSQLDIQNAYTLGHCQGELAGRMALSHEIAVQYGIDSGEHKLDREEVLAIGVRQIH